MKDAYVRLGEQLAAIAEEGKFGESIRAARTEYEQIPTGILTFLKCVLDAEGRRDGTNEEIRQSRRLFTRFVVSAYRDARKADKDVAQALLLSLIEDYPGVPESCLYPQFCAFAEAALAFREVATSSNRLLIWKQLTRLTLSYNEFLNALSGFLIPCLRLATGKQPDPGVFGMPYGSRVDQLSSLTGGNSGEFSAIVRLAKPRLRNAVAHDTIWLDADASKVRYTEGSKLKKEYEMGLSEFGALALLGSHLGEPYLAAIGAIAVVEDGSELAVRLLPQYLVDTFRS